MKLTGWLVLFLFLLSCSESPKKEAILDESFMSIKYSESSKREDILLSELVESLEILKLDNKEEALVSPSFVQLSKNYICIVGWHLGEPCKLFNKKGKYISTIGSFGQGPGEYTSIYSFAINEESGYVYVVPYDSKTIMAYDFKGKYSQEHSIPLSYRAPKCNFYLDTDKNQVIILSLSFQENSENNVPVCWIQDLKGNVLQEVRSNRLQVTPDFSNEVMFTYNNKGIYDVQFKSFFKTVQDSLYHYDIDKNRLIPKFSVYDPNVKAKRLFDYLDLPLCYLIRVVFIQINARVDLDVGGEEYILVDKKTGTTRYGRLINDYLGNLEVNFMDTRLWPRHGYLTMMFEPGALKELLEEKLEDGGMEEQEREKVGNWIKDLSENDNCILMYGKLKHE